MPVPKYHLKSLMHTVGLYVSTSLHFAVVYLFLFSVLALSKAYIFPSYSKYAIILLRIAVA